MVGQSAVRSPAWQSIHECSSSDAMSVMRDEMRGVEGQKSRLTRFTTTPIGRKNFTYCAFLIQAVSCSMAQAAYMALVDQSRKDLAVESGGKTAFESSNGHSAGVKPPSPRANRS